MISAASIAFQVRVTSGMAPFGPVTSAWEVASFNMEVSTKQHRVLNRLPAAGACKVTTGSASGVTGVMVMER